MHNSLNDAAIIGPNSLGLKKGESGPYLLKSSDQSSVCLNCHEGSGEQYKISTPASAMPNGIPPQQLTPGGDFGWLKKSYSWVPSDNSSGLSRGEHHGHSIVAADYGYVADSTISTAPGGEAFQYPAATLSCISCHDPHGQYRIAAAGVMQKSAPGTATKPIRDSGSYGDLPNAYSAVGVYRLLAGAGYQPKSLSGSYAFTYPAFYAVAPSTYNISETTSDMRVAYGKSVSLWCANCHALMHSTFGAVVHPADQALGSSGDITSNYNAYKKSGNVTGVRATAYSSLVPFQLDNTTDLAALTTATTSTAGPITTDRVMCLSCHRAHASGFDSMMRWGMGNEFMTVADAAGNPIYPDPAANPDQAQGRTVAEQQQAYYGRPASRFAPYQRIYGCNKCHAKD
jgi:hypothetical protein